MCSCTNNIFIFNIHSTPLYLLFSAASLHSTSLHLPILSILTHTHGDYVLHFCYTYPFCQLDSYHLVIVTHFTPVFKPTLAIGRRRTSELEVYQLDIEVTLYLVGISLDVLSCSYSSSPSFQRRRSHGGQVRGTDLPEKVLCYELFRT